MNRDEQHSDVDKTGAARASSIELRIEELVLHGFEPRDRYRIGEAVERELARLFAERGAASSLGHGREAATLDAGEVAIAQGMTPEAIGAQVARAVYGGMISK
jgi:predicted amidohydrolase